MTPPAAPNRPRYRTALAATNDQRHAAALASWVNERLRPVPMGPQLDVVPPGPEGATTAEVAPRTEVRKDVPAPAPPAPSSGVGWIVPLAVLIVGMFMSVLDSSIVNVAIPDIQNELSGSLRQNLLWERQQKNATTNAAMRRAATTTDLQGMGTKIQPQPMNTSAKNPNSYFDQGLGSYHTKGW